jgi:hypothetical protein
VKPPFDYRVCKTVHTSPTYEYWKIHINIRKHSMPMSSKSSLYFMFSHRKLLCIPVSAMRGFASLLVVITVRQSEWGCRDLRRDGIGEVHSFEMLQQCLSNFILGFCFTGTTKKILKTFHTFSQTRLRYSWKNTAVKMVFSLNVTDRLLRECEKERSPG